MAQSTKILIVGDSGVGKTSYINALNKAKFNGVYHPTQDFKVHHVIDDISITTVVDTPGERKMEFGLLSKTHTQIDAAIIMFDLNTLTTFKTITQWIRNIYKVYGQIPIVIVGNKADSRDRKVDSITPSIKYEGFKYFETSAKDKTGLKLPLLQLQYMINKGRTNVV